MYDGPVGPIQATESIRAIDPAMAAGLMADPVRQPADRQAPARRPADFDRVELDGDPSRPQTYATMNVDHDTGMVNIKIVDARTDEVIREIPSEQAVALAKELRAYADARLRGGR